MARHHDEDLAGSAERAFLRLAVSYGGSLTPAGASRGLGLSRQAAGSTAAALAQAGWLSVEGTARRRSYRITPDGLAHLEASRSSFLLVRVDDRMAEDVAAVLATGFSGVEEVTVHGGGCCCQHCPHDGRCR